VAATVEDAWGKTVRHLGHGWAVSRAGKAGDARTV
jgi:hypothetical protein